MPRGALLVFRDERDSGAAPPSPDSAAAFASKSMTVEYLRMRAAAERAAAGCAGSDWARNLHLELARAYEDRILTLR